MYQACKKDIVEQYYCPIYCIVWNCGTIVFKRILYCNKYGLFVDTNSMAIYGNILAVGIPFFYSLNLCIFLAPQGLEKNI